MGLKLSNLVEWQDEPWIITEGRESEQEFVLLVTLNSKPTQQELAVNVSFSPDRTEADDTDRLPINYYFLENLLEGVYEATSYNLDCEIWFKVDKNLIVEVTRDYLTALNWFKAHRILVPFRCGHEEWKTVYGSPERVQLAYVDYLTWNYCSYCYKINQYQYALKFNHSLSCAPLWGTNNQLMWAEQIRAAVMRELKSLELNRNTFWKECKNRGLEDVFDVLLLKLKQEHRAEFWIQYQGLNFWELLGRLRGMYGDESLPSA